MSKYSILALVMCMAISACNKKQELGAAPAPMAAAPASSRAKQADSLNKTARYLAYEHSINLDTEQTKISEVFEAAQTICREATDDLCTILESRINTGREASAALKFRAKPNGIQKIILALNKKAEITNQATTAEDLTTSIEDSAKKLAMLTDYRSKLEALRVRASSDVESLIKVNKELAQVQSDIEERTGINAQLLQRVNTEILSISINSVENLSFWRPITLAMSDFGKNLSQGFSTAISAVAYLIPWIFSLLLVFWVSRKLWFRRKKAQTSV
jgi:glycine cleavage system regulatory protein